MNASSSIGEVVAKSYTLRKLNSMSSDSESFVECDSLLSRISSFFDIYTKRVCPPLMMAVASLSPALHLISMYNFSSMPSLRDMLMVWASISFFPSSTASGVLSFNTSS